MRNLFFVLIYLFCFSLNSKVTLKANSIEEKDLSCITLLKLSSEKSKEAGEMIKYEKLKKLEKNYLAKYKDNFYSKESIEIKLNEHIVKIKEKGQRYVNKGLQKCGLK